MVPNLSLLKNYLSSTMLKVGLNDGIYGVRRFESESMYGNLYEQVTKSSWPTFLKSSDL